MGAGQDGGGAEGRVRELLERFAGADGASGDAAAELLPIVYEELKRIARRQMGRERAAHTLQATALVHEAWVRLVGPGDVEWNERVPFLDAAAVAMRRILVEHARARAGPRRGGGLRRVELADSAALTEAPGPELLDLDAALERLEAHDPRKARVVHLRYFAGLSLEETAAALGVSLGTVKNDWSYARAWLYRELEKGASE